jgi:pyridoxamine 5'-phosphate oxidase
MNSMDCRLFKHALLFLIRPWLWDTRALKLSDLATCPFQEFGRWFSLARRCFWLEFGDGMCLSTIDHAGCPDSRMVLLKGYDSRGFVFYTNSLSRKGQQISANPQAAINFYWEPLQRQIRIQGALETVSPAEADAYFASRPRLSQLGAWASNQSAALVSRDELISRVEDFKQKFAGGPVPRPPHWLGYRLLPKRFEFWKLKPSRLHDRFVYTIRPEGGWCITRLYP